MISAYGKMVEELVSTGQSSEKKALARKRLPVPSDFKIAWAFTDGVNSNPSGIAITDKGVVIKGKTRVDGKGKEKRINSPYQIIPWDIFTPEDFQVKRDGEGFTIGYGGVEFTGCGDATVGRFFKKCKEQYRLTELKNEEWSDTIKVQSFSQETGKI